MTGLDKPKEMIKTFPKLPKREKSMIEIGGCRNNENVNSDYLAFFLKEDEDHGLGRLFFDSLLEVWELVTSDFQGEYEVKREFPTSKNNRIDIVIKSKSNEWAIIIENKIYHVLGNDLQDYWDSVKDINEKNKEGVILSLRKEHQKYHGNFINITHLELINKVKEKFGREFSNSNPKYLPFLRDFILNVENYYYYEREDVKQTYQDRLFYYFKSQDNKQRVEEDIDNKKRVEEDIDNIFRRKLGAINFQPVSTKKTDWWHYYDKKERFQIYYDRSFILREKDKRISIRLSVKNEYYSDKFKSIEINNNSNDKLEIIREKKEKKDANITRILNVSHKLTENSNYVEMIQEVVDIIKEYLQKLNQK